MHDTTSTSFEIFTGDHPNHVLVEKAKLLEKYNLVPKGFLDYVQLKAFYNNSVLVKTRGHASLATHHVPEALEFMQRSEVFISKYKGGVLESDVLSNRASVLRDMATKWKPKLEETDLTLYPQIWHYTVSLDDAQQEFLEVLKLDYKGWQYYHALTVLEDIAYLQNNKTRVKILENAHDLYIRRVRAGALDLRSKGVDDFLKENGILK